MFRHLADLKNKSRFDLFMSLAIWCMISNAQSETESAHVAERNCTKGVPDTINRCFAVCKERQSESGRDKPPGLLTVHDNPHVLDQTVDYLQGLCCGISSLINSEPI